MNSLNQITTNLFINPQYDQNQPYGSERQKILSQSALKAAEQDLHQWPGFHQTPLYHLPELANTLNVADICYKDEGSRFGLGSFKSLGGAYAVSRLLRKEIGKKLNRSISMQELFDDDIKKISASITVTCATDGNHGRSVAWGAKMFGCQCIIYIHALVSEGRKVAIEQYDASVIRVAGNYDDAVRQADIDAQKHNRFVISDTSYPGYMDVPRDVMQGYQVMVKEADEQLNEMPTHIFIQAGVGGLAAAVCSYFWEMYKDKKPIFVVVEPTEADCLLQSAQNGKPTAVKGELNTLMAGLACGEISLLAWEILEQGTYAYCSITDASAISCMKLLASPYGNDPAIVAGESAVAGLAAAIASSLNEEQRKALHITTDSRFLLFGSETATDPALYEQLVGQTAPENIKA